MPEPDEDISSLVESLKKSKAIVAQAEAAGLKVPGQQIFGMAEKGAQGTIDSLIGKEPGDAFLLQYLRDYQEFSTSVLAPVSRRYASTLYPGTDETQARLAVGAIHPLYDPWTVGDDFIAGELQGNERLANLYIRDTDPLSLLPYIVETDKNKSGWFSKSKDVVGDALGRPIGFVSDVFSWPLEQSEELIGTHVIWNSISDPAVRHVLASHMSWQTGWAGMFSSDERARMRAAKRQALSIESRGLTGDFAAEEMERWFSTPEGRPSMQAAITSVVAEMVGDPLNLLFFGPIAAKTGEGLGIIGKVVPRILGPGFKGAREEKGVSVFRAMMDAAKADELTWAGSRIHLPPRGPTNYLFSQTAERAASDASRQFSLALAKSDLVLDDVARLSEAMLQAKATPEVVARFGPSIFGTQQTAQMAQLVKKHQWSLIDHVLPTDPKDRLLFDDLLRASPPQEARNILRDLTEGALQAASKDFYDELLHIPRWMKGAKAIAAGQKLVMGVFTLGRMAFVPLNVANNTLTFMWHSALHPVDMSKALAGASYALSPWGKGRILDSTSNIIKSVGADPEAVIRNWTAITSDVDALSLKVGQKAQAVKPEDWSKVLANMRKRADFPAKLERDFDIRSLVASPVTMAGAVDRWARMATGEFALRQQLHMTLAPRSIAAGPLANFRETLIDMGATPRAAEQAERKAISALQHAAIREGKPIFREDVLTEILNPVLRETAETLGGGLSGVDIFIQWSMQRKGMSGGMDSWLLMRDYLAETTKIDEIIAKRRELTPTQRDAMFDQIEDGAVGFDRWQQRMTQTDDVIRETPSYVSATGLNENSIRQSMEDHVLYLDRVLAQTHWGEWKPGLVSYEDFYKSTEGTVGLLEDLADIRRQRIQILIDGGDVKQVAARYPAYFEKRDAVWEDIYQTVRKHVGKRNTAAAEKLDKWYANLKKLQQKQADNILKAVGADTPEAWVEAGNANKILFSQQARQNAKIFGVQINNPPRNQAHTRPSAVLTDDIADLMQFAKQAMREGLGETPENYALGISRAEALKPGITREQIDKLEGLVKETATNMAAVRQQVLGQAQALTDFVMLNYNRQYGIDSLMQVFFPYEYFPTRSVAHWATRAMTHPAAFSKLVMFATRPAEYSQQYGIPERLQFAIPIPLPFMGELVNRMPVLGGKIATNQWGSVYWIDPMAVLFPFTYDMREQFRDEQKRATPMGMVMDWAENSIPMGLSPFAKIIGSESGMLDKDAWEYGLFRGGPFGISPSIVARGAALWLQTGDDSEVPEEEQRNYTEGGFFGTDFLRRVFAVEPDRWDDYRTERAGAALIATGELIPGASREEQRDQFYVAMKTKSGPLWKKALKYSRSTQFLADLTGFAFVRVTPVMEGELKIRMGERHLYQEAARRGELEAFYERYPEYEVYSTAVRGVSDPEAKEKAVATNLYYQSVEKYVEGPYQLQLTQIDEMLSDLSDIDPQTSDIQKQKSVLIAARKSIRDEQSEIRSMLDAAFGDREDSLSLLRDPKERSLMGVESLYYDIPSIMGDTPEFTEEEVSKLQDALLRGLSGDTRIWESLSQEMLIKAKGRTDLPEDKVEAARELLLSRFPAYDPSIHSEQDWHDLTVASLQEKFGSSIQIAKAIQDGDYAQIEQIQIQRERDLNTLHSLARARLTRYEVEAFLGRNKRAETTEEREFNEAEYLFDLWMALVGDGSPLTNRQQAAVSAYFRQHPMIQKHYPSEAIDASTLDAQGIVDILRRREIWSTYYDISDVDTQLDYMHGVQDELNEINARLGLRPLTLIDPRPLPPEPLGGAWSGADDFQGEDERQALIALAREEGLSDAEIGALLEDWSSETGLLTPDEIDRLIDMSDRRGY